MRNSTGLRDVERRGTIDTSNAVAMGIDKAGMTVVMQMLSNMYSNGFEAVVREYSCNARDSHVEAGQTLPIEVHLPTPLDPQFKVQDYGIGLSKEGILRTYAQYGASTKRDSNEQIGAFGIGSKSAFTVGTAFTVTGVKDGEKTIAMFSLDDSGTPSVQILFNGPTEEGNGVLVDMGVENVSAVRTAADKLFSCWQPGTVLVDGEEPKSRWAETETLAEGVYISWRDLNNGYNDYYGRTQYRSADHFTLLMGGVPYNIPNALWSELRNEARVFYDKTMQTFISWVIDVPIGGVDITPSREELRVTPHTRATVEKMILRLVEALPGWLAKKIEDSATIWEAGRTYRTLSRRINYDLPSKLVQWNGKSLGENSFKLTYSTFTLVRLNNYHSNPKRQYKIVESETFPVWIMDEHFEKRLFVHSVPDDKRNIIKVYSKAVLSDPDNEYTSITITPHKSERIGWFSYGTTESPVGVMSFAEYHALGKKLRKASSANTPRGKTMYETLAPGDLHWKMRNADDIEDLDLIPLHTRFRNGLALNTNNPIHKEILDTKKYVVVRLTGSQKLSVLEKNVEGTKSLSEFFKEYAGHIVNQISTKDILLLKARARKGSTNTDVIEFLRKHESKIINARVRMEIQSFNSATKLTNADTARLNYLDHAFAVSGTNPYAEDNSDDFFVTKLPLLYVTLHQAWTAERLLGGEEYVNALVNYVNDTRV